MGPRQSLSEVVGTHVVLDCKWITTVFYTQYCSPPPPPPQSMLLQPKHIEPDEKWDTTLNRGRVDWRLLKFKCFVASVPRLLKLIVDTSLYFRDVASLQFSAYLWFRSIWRYQNFWYFRKSAVSAVFSVFVI
jgi:hypothetical protein